MATSSAKQAMLSTSGAVQLRAKPTMNRATTTIVTQPSQGISQPPSYETASTELSSFAERVERRHDNRSAAI